MIKFILNSFILLILSEALYVQLHLDKKNCDPVKETSIYLRYKNIKMIEPSIFNVLSSIQRLMFSYNQISSIELDSEKNHISSIIQLT
jgi:hypothetical protein